MFLCDFNVAFLLLLNISVQDNAFLIAKLRLASIFWTKRVFCSSIIDFIWFVLTIDGFYLNEYCSLMFLCMFLMFS